MSRPIIFLDDGGVMNDNTLRGSQWPPMVSAFFEPLLGGNAEAWQDANRSVIEHILDSQNWQARLQAARNYQDFERTYQLDWLGGMCKRVGIPLPADEKMLELADAANQHIIRRVRASFPGAIDAIKNLHSQGYTLHTASGEPSTDLEGHLEGMGVRHCFGRLYGPDLIDTFKESPDYYTRIFADLAIEPKDALVVDDSPHVLRRAALVGARTILVHPNPPPGTEALTCISSLAELPAILSTKTSQ